MTTLRLRGHHIYCLRYNDVEFPERGEPFGSTYERIRKTLDSVKPDTRIQIVVGPDDLCTSCPISSPEGCRSPQGGEGQIRKWDNIILGGLGLESGAELPVKEYQALLETKSPISFCYRCRVGVKCHMRDLAQKSVQGPG